MFLLCSYAQPKPLSLNIWYARSLRDKYPAHRHLVEVHFTAVGGFDKSIPLAGNKFRHMAMVFRFMRLDLAAQFASGILDLALCRRECILASRP